MRYVSSSGEHILELQGNKVSEIKHNKFDYILAHDSLAKAPYCDVLTDYIKIFKNYAKQDAIINSLSLNLQSANNVKDCLFNYLTRGVNGSPRVL